MSESDGRVIGTTILQDSGKRGFNLVIVSEGYQQAELPTFATDAKAFMDKFFMTPRSIRTRLGSTSIG